MAPAAAYSRRQRRGDRAGPSEAQTTPAQQKMDQLCHNFKIVVERQLDKRPQLQHKLQKHRLPLFIWPLRSPTPSEKRLISMAVGLLRQHSAMLFTYTAAGGGWTVACSHTCCSPPLCLGSGRPLCPSSSALGRRSTAGVFNGTNSGVTVARIHAVSKAAQFPTAK